MKIGILFGTKPMGNSVDRLTSIIQTTDGGYLIGGSSDSDISAEKTDNSRGNIDIWIIKIDQSEI
jgi:hypothetical protein